MAFSATAAPAFAQDTVLPAAERYKPTPVADRVILVPTADPAHSQTVNWRSTAQAPKAQIIEAPAAFGDVQRSNLPTVDGTDYSKIVTLDATTTTMNPGNVGYTNRYHAVTFTGLKPSTRYSYRVGDGTNPNTSGAGAASVSNWSAWETSPPPMTSSRRTRSSTSTTRRTTSTPPFRACSTRPSWTAPTRASCCTRAT